MQAIARKFGTKLAQPLPKSLLHSPIANPSHGNPGPATASTASTAALLAIILPAIGKLLAS